MRIGVCASDAAVTDALTQKEDVHAQNRFFSDRCDAAFRVVG